MTETGKGRARRPPAAGHKLARRSASHPPGKNIEGVALPIPDPAVNKFFLPGRKTSVHRAWSGAWSRPETVVRDKTTTEL
jgi:hypothetical protein